MAGKQHGFEARYLEAGGIDTDQSGGLAWWACVLPLTPYFRCLGGPWSAVLLMFVTPCEPKPFIL